MSWIWAKRTSPVFWGFVLTGLVLLFGYWVAGFEHYDEDWVLRSNWEHFKAAAPNEIGDTLAGFAGALAFVWIIVTVWLQSKELAAQREELRLTREEMAEQKLATQEMAHAQSEQVRLLEAQAKLFRDEQTQRDEARAKAKLDQQLELLLACLADFWRSAHWSYSTRQTSIEFTRRKLLGEVFGEPIADDDFDEIENTFSLMDVSEKRGEDSLRNLAESLRKGRDFLKGLPEWSFIEKPSLVPLKITLNALLEIQGASDGLSEDQLVRLRRWRLDDLGAVMKEIASLDVWSERVHEI